MCQGPAYMQPPACPAGLPLAGAVVGPEGRGDLGWYLRVVVVIDRGDRMETVTTGPFTDVPGVYGGVVQGRGLILVAGQGLGWSIGGLTRWVVQGAQTVRVDVLAGAEERTTCTDPGAEGTVRTECTRAQQPRLALTCTSPTERLPDNQVTRGKEIVCTARKEPADAVGELSDIAWQFTGGDFKFPDEAAGERAGPEITGSPAPLAHPAPGDGATPPPSPPPAPGSATPRTRPGCA